MLDIDRQEPSPGCDSASAGNTDLDGEADSTASGPAARRGSASPHHVPFRHRGVRSTALTLAGGARATYDLLRGLGCELQLPHY